MHKLEIELIEKGIIDSELTSFSIGDWYANTILSFVGKEDKVIYCIFDDCYEINFQHDLFYLKEKNNNGTNNFKYFVQNIEIIEKTIIFIVLFQLGHFRVK